MACTDFTSCFSTFKKSQKSRYTLLLSYWCRKTFRAIFSNSFLDDIVNMSDAVTKAIILGKNTNKKHRLRRCFWVWLILYNLDSMYGFISACNFYKIHSLLQIAHVDCTFAKVINPCLMYNFA